MTTTLTEKLTLHIPHAACVNGQLIPVDYAEMENLLYTHFMDSGFPSWYSLEAAGFYKGRRFQETLVTIYCEETRAAEVQKIFKETCWTRKEDMKQESFGYEYNGKFYVIDFTKQKESVTITTC